MCISASVLIVHDIYAWIWWFFCHFNLWRIVCNFLMYSKFILVSIPTILLYGVLSLRFSLHDIFMYFEFIAIVFHRCNTSMWDSTRIRKKICNKLSPCIKLTKVKTNVQNSVAKATEHERKRCKYSNVQNDKNTQITVFCIIRIKARKKYPHNRLWVNIWMIRARQQKREEHRNASSCIKMNLMIVAIIQQTNTHTHTHTRH